MCSYTRSRSIKGVNKLGFLLQLAFYDLKASWEKAPTMCSQLGRANREANDAVQSSSLKPWKK